MKPKDDEDLINSDEILRSLTHRAAYRAHVAMRWLLLPGALVLTQIVHDEKWNIVGYTLFVVFFLTSLFFEVILAYDGVFKGLEELRRSIVMDKETIFRRAAWIFIQVVAFYILLGRLVDDDASLVDDVVQGALVGLIFSSMHFYRWRHIVDKKSS